MLRKTCGGGFEKPAAQAVLRPLVTLLGIREDGYMHSLRSGATMVKLVISSPIVLHRARRELGVGKSDYLGRSSQFFGKWDKPQNSPALRCLPHGKCINPAAIFH